jgi:hypothetical protein
MLPETALQAAEEGYEMVVAVGGDGQPTGAQRFDAGACRAPSTLRLAAPGFWQ